MIFELPDIFFGSHPKKEKVSQPMQMGQCGFTKKSEKALPQAAFSKNPVISFSVQRAISSGCNGFQLHPLLFFAKSIDKDIVREYTLMI